MEVQDVNVYLEDTDTGQIESSNVSRSSSRYPPQKDQMTMFPEWREGDWMTGGGAYERFVVELVTNTGESGFCANESGGEYAANLVDRHYRRFIEGSSPWEITRVWEQMYRAQLPTGQGGLNHMAISAVELAFWDLLGNITGEPVYKLLGGKVRDEIDLYVTAYPDMMESWADRGFFGVKLPVHHGPNDRLSGLNALEEMVTNARSHFGETAEIMLEGYMAWDKEYTVRVAERLKSYDIKWIEDPIVPDHSVSQYQDLQEQIKPIQLAVGNLEWGHKSFDELINRGAGDIIQPDVSWAGGLTEARRIAAMAKPKGLPVVPHYTTPYTCHFIISQPECPYGEWMAGWNDEIQKNIPTVQGEYLPENGTITVPDKPGFGLKLDRTNLVQV